MAIDQTEKRRALARQVVQAAPALMDVLYRLDALCEMRDNGGVGGAALVFQDADFTDNGLKHIDAATLDAALAAVPTILTAFTNQGFKKKFEALRP